MTSLKLILETLQDFNLKLFFFSELKIGSQELLGWGRERCGGKCTFFMNQQQSKGAVISLFLIQSLPVLHNFRFTVSLIIKKQ